jgi:hypothetical protein
VKGNHEAKEWIAKISENPASKNETKYEQVM